MTSKQQVAQASTSATLPRSRSSARIFNAQPRRSLASTPLSRHCSTMASTKLTDRASPAVIPIGTPPMKATRLPPYLRLFLLIALNLIISSTLWTTTANFLGNELGIVSKPEGGNVEAAARLSYKIGVVWAGWWLSYDCKAPSEVSVDHC
jgi:hypothetical protein